MVDSNRDSQQSEGGRPPRRGGSRSETRGQRPSQPRPQSGLPASDYASHLENEHRVLVVEETGWPTDIKRYRLVRPAVNKGSEKVLAIFEGTRPQAISHFYRYLHPQGDQKPVETAGTQGIPEAGPASSGEAA